MCVKKNVFVSNWMFDNVDGKVILEIYEVKLFDK